MYVRMTRLRPKILYWVCRIIINIQTANFYNKYWAQTQSLLQVVASILLTKSDLVSFLLVCAVFYDEMSNI